ncbi:hypothetical protein CALVIDRAFT_566964 [Calocera viscosa TUFC12733]|uniref:Uncharacterized protein n=1 Tax=Calocera viscosa (strain TUFC12733) TaxID=1330018 RepID=A0A167IQF1_CALVF|nr:hypothetical protein CALVIDRAFT_566964 [Calocera viscosa TUFC12733]
MPFRAFPTSKPASREPPMPNYVPKLAPRRPEVIRPMVYMQDAMIDEFFGDTRAMKGKRPHVSHGLPQEHADYGVELNYVDQNGIPWKDKVERQQHQELLSSRSRTQIAAADAAAGLRKPYGGHMRPQQSWASFDSDSTPDEEADDHSSTGESFESDVMDRHIRTVSSEFNGYIPSGNERNAPLPAATATYMPHKPKIVKGADAFPEPAPPKHLHPEMTAHTPRPHGPSRRRQADPVVQVVRVDPVEQARLDFMRTALPPSAPPTRRSSIRGSEQTPVSRTSSSGRDSLSPEHKLPARASFESRASSRAESSCPSLSNGHSGSSRSPSSAASSLNHLPNTQAPAPFKLTHASVKEARRASQPFAFLSRSAPQAVKKTSAGPPTVQPKGPPTIQPRGQPPSHGPTKSASSTSLRARFNSFSRSSVTAIDTSETGSLMGKNNVVSKGLSGFFKRNKN